MFNSKQERIEDFWSLCTMPEHPLHLIEDLDEIGFFTAPASSKYHGAYEGGLYDHSAMVTRRLLELTAKNNLKWQRPESPFIIGMFHDLCKCDQYIPIIETQYVSKGKDKLVVDDVITGYEYNTKTLLKGHGSKSIILLSKFITLTEEEILCIRYHMGAYGNEQEQKDEWAGFDQAAKKFETVLWAHHADQLASKIDGI